MLGLALAPAFFGLGVGLQEVDAAQYADVARRILETGEWLHLRDMNGPFVNKPPVMMWAQALTMVVLGVSNLAARLPTLFFGALAVLGTFWAGRTLKDAQHAIVAGALLGSSVAFHSMIADPKVDMPLMAFTTLAIAATLAARERPRLIWAAWAFAALGMLSKGPIGVVLPMLAVGPEVIRAQWQPGTSWLGRIAGLKPIRGLLLVALIISPFYYTLATRVGSEALHFMLWRQNVGRLDGSSGYRDTSTPLFFLHTALWAFLPFVPLTIANLIRRAVGLARAREMPGAIARIPVWWLLLPLLLISSSANKLPQYLYWSTPAAALLATDEIFALSERGAKHWLLGVRVLSALACLAGLLTVVFVAPASWWWLGLLVATPILIAWRTARLAPVHRLSYALLGSLVAGLVMFKGAFLPWLLTHQPFEAIGERVQLEEPNQTVLPVCAMAPPYALAFYSHRVPRYMSPTELREAVNESGPRLMLLGPDFLPRQDFEAMGLQLTPVARYLGYPISRVNGRFLNGATREASLKPLELMRVSLAPSAL